MRAGSYAGEEYGSWLFRCPSLGLPPSCLGTSKQGIALYHSPIYSEHQQKISSASGRPISKQKFSSTERGFSFSPEDGE
jgi:hypothetical protein